MDPSRRYKEAGGAVTPQAGRKRHKQPSHTTPPHQLLRASSRGASDAFMAFARDDSARLPVTGASPADVAAVRSGVQSRVDARTPRVTTANPQNVAAGRTVHSDVLPTPYSAPEQPRPSRSRQDATRTALPATAMTPEQVANFSSSVRTVVTREPPTVSRYSAPVAAPRTVLQPVAVPVYLQPSAPSHITIVRLGGELESQYTSEPESRPTERASRVRSTPTPPKQNDRISRDLAVIITGIAITILGIVFEAPLVAAAGLLLIAMGGASMAYHCYRQPRNVRPLVAD